MAKPQPWSPADATDAIRRLATHDRLTLSYSGHAKDRMLERDLYISDIRHVLKHGFVYDPPERATQDGLYKFNMDGKTPNSGARVVRVTVVPDETKVWMKIVTVQWVDE